MRTIQILQRLDAIAQQAYSVWNQCEALKLRIADDRRVSRTTMGNHGIFVPRTKKAPPGIPNEA